MTYPAVLLPCSDRRKIDIESLKSDNYFLIRYLNEEDLAKLVHPRTGKINVKRIFPSDQSKDLSTFLAGHYTEDHVQLQLQGENADFLGSYCNPDDTVCAPIYPKDFIVNLKRGCWHLKISDILGAIQTIVDRNNKGIEVNSWEIHCKIEHTPTICNYWHFSVRWKISGIDLESHHLDPKTGAPLPSHSSFKSFKTTVRAYLVQYCQVDFPSNPAILPDSEFLKAV